METLPAISTLRSLLLKQPFNGMEKEEIEFSNLSQSNQSLHGKESDKKLYTIRDLRQIIQASDEQLNQGLNQLKALEINGYWRILHPAYIETIFNQILDIIVADDIPYNAISIKHIQDQLLDYPADVVEHCLRMHSLEDSKNKLYKLDETAVCRFRFIQLMGEKEPYPHEELMRDWNAKVPYGMNPNVDMLRGYAINDDERYNDPFASSSSSSSSSSSTSLPGPPPKPRGWRYTPLDFLPKASTERFDLLFNLRQYWKYDDLVPYTSDLCTPGQNLVQLLLKYCRQINDPQQQKQLLYVKK